eukprot:TRINITY_DN9262_c0_g1_i1.p1 TRINITY_DN9262_c0_g1~~TRINITY_DN9262_c0_g1_i1.p1  ORF type:complete len:1969 (+),score=520.41 TRINITY_DN9262_c0_g1_i1:103-6009(+)
MERYWVPHPGHVWVPAWLRGVQEVGLTKVASFATDGGEVITVPPEKVASFNKAEEEELQGVDDVCSLAKVSEAAILHAIRTRYARQEIYTRVSRMVIAINPFQALNIYSSKDLDRYASAANTLDLKPHIFSVGADALRGLRDQRQDQVVVISGESGAGKTESAKLVMSFVAEARGNSNSSASRPAGDGENVQSLYDRVLRSNPLLEAFGNAMTVRNTNSSRFGKLLEFNFASGCLAGCTITQYLLEVSRVCSQAKGERSYHIFYQLLQAREKDALLAPLRLLPPASYRYLSGSETKAPGINDATAFEETQEAFLQLGFEHGTQADVFRILAAVLLLGNCDFEQHGEDEVLRFTSAETTIKRVAELLKIDKEVLGRQMTFRKLTVAGDTTEVPMRLDQARAMRDGLSRLIYGLLFRWLVRRLNISLKTCRQERMQEVCRLGILDIAGFESFEKNSLEQLLINLSNEHMQLVFNNCLFKAELDDCEREGVSLDSSITYVDNSDVLILIDGKAGILDMLDEEGAFAKATDQTFVSKVINAHGKHPRFVTSKFAGGLTAFGIRHYAGTVMYESSGFLAKNSDKVMGTEGALLEASSIELLHELAGLLTKGEEEGSPPLANGESSPSNARSKAAKAKKTPSGTARFRASLHSLRAKVDSCSPHFVRCVKPNREKQPNKFDSQMVNEQLLLSGVLEVVRIRKEGFVARLPFKEFVDRYICIVDANFFDDAPSDLRHRHAYKDQPGLKHERLKGQARLLLQVLQRGLKLAPNEAIMHTTMVFLKASAQEKLEASRGAALMACVIRLQKMLRGWRTRKQVKAMKTELARTKEWLVRCKPPRGSMLAYLGSLSDAENALGQIDALLGKSVRRTRTSSWCSSMSRQQSMGLRRASRSSRSSLGQLLGDEAWADTSETLQLPALRRQWKDVMLARLQLCTEVETVQQLQRLQHGLDAVAIDVALARARELGLPSAMCPSGLQARAEALRLQLPLVQALRASLGLPSLRPEDTSDGISDDEDTPKSSSTAGAGAKMRRHSSVSPSGLLKHVQVPLYEVLAQVDKLMPGSGDRADSWLPELDGATLVTQARQKNKAEGGERPVFMLGAPESGDFSQTGWSSDASPSPRGEPAAAHGALKKPDTMGRKNSVRRSVVFAIDADTPAQAAAASSGAGAGGGGSSGSRSRAHGSAGHQRRRSTITGLDAAAQVRLLAGLRQAAEEYDAVTLEELLSEAVRQGVDAKEVSGPQQVLTMLQNEAFLVAATREAQQQAEQPVPPGNVLRRLQNLSHQIRVTQGDLEVARSAMKTFHRGARRKSRLSSRGSLLRGMDTSNLIIEEEDLSGPFAELANFSKLKPLHAWGGHRASHVFQEIVPKRRENMLGHSKVAIAEALTRIPEQREELAVQNFRNLLFWMGDKPAQECQRLAAKTSIVELVTTETDMRDEVYLQVLKQLRNNHSPRSTLLGWQLLQTLCQEALPGEELAEFLRLFLLIAAGGTGASSTLANVATEVQGLAKQCLAALIRNDAAHFVGEQEEPGEGDLNAQGADGLVGIAFRLVDGSLHDLYAPVHCTLGQLCGQAGQKLGIRHWRDFSFYQLLDMETAVLGCKGKPSPSAALTHSVPPRLLPEHLDVAELCSRWHQLKEATGCAGRLLWMRRFLRPQEVLLAADPIHAKLTYVQALLSYLRGTVSAGDELEVHQRIGAAILCVEFDGATLRLREKENFLGNLLPIHCMRELEQKARGFGTFEKWCDKIQEATKSLRTQLGPRAHHHQRMNGLFMELQRTRHFGSHCWPARVTAAAGNVCCLTDPPQRHLTAPLWSHEQEASLFVDVRGVHVQLSQAYHSRHSWGAKPRCLSFAFRRAGRNDSYLADMGAVNNNNTGQGGTLEGRLLRWGARQGHIHFVVHAPTSPDGQHATLVTLTCSHALDVAYMVHRALSEPGVAQERNGFGEQSDTFRSHFGANVSALSGVSPRSVRIAAGAQYR